MCKIVCSSTSHTLSQLIFKEFYQVGIITSFKKKKKITKTLGLESLRRPSELIEPVGGKDGVWILYLIPIPTFLLHSKPSLSSEVSFFKEYSKTAYVYYDEWI